MRFKGEFKIPGNALRSDNAGSKYLPFKYRNTYCDLNAGVIGN